MEIIDEIYFKEIDKLIYFILPTVESETKRINICKYLTQCLSEINSINEELYISSTGSTATKLYLPESDIDLVILYNKHSEKHNEISIILNIFQCLCQEALGMNHRINNDIITDNDSYFVYNLSNHLIRNYAIDVINDKYVIRNVELINARTKLCHCFINNIGVDITINHISAIATAIFLEEIDRFIGSNHLFKRSVLLIKTWCLNDCKAHCGKSILGSKDGMFSSYSLCILIIRIFNDYPIESLTHPLVVFKLFLYHYGYLSKSWNNTTIVSINGISGSSYNSITQRNKFISIMNKFIIPNHCNTSTVFTMRDCNIQDPLDNNNNLGISVTSSNFILIKQLLENSYRQLQSLLYYHPYANTTNYISNYTSNQTSDWFINQFFSISYSIYIANNDIRLRSDLCDHPMRHQYNNKYENNNVFNDQLVADYTNYNNYAILKCDLNYMWLKYNELLLFITINSTKANKSTNSYCSHLGENIHSNVVSKLNSITTDAIDSKIDNVIENAELVSQIVNSINSDPIAAELVDSVPDEKINKSNNKIKSRVKRNKKSTNCYIIIIIVTGLVISISAVYLKYNHINKANDDILKNSSTCILTNDIPKLDLITVTTNTLSFNNITTSTNWVKLGASLSFGPNTPDNYNYIYIWKKDNYTILESSYKYFTLLTVTIHDIGKYDCFQVDKHKNMRIIYSTIIKIAEKPYVKTKPIYSELREGSNLFINLHSEGKPEPHYYWYKNGFIINQLSAIKSTFYISNVNKSNTGTYSCKVVNIAGEFLWLEATIIVRD